MDERGGVYSLIACLSHLVVDHASLSRQITVPTPDRNIFNGWELIAFFSHTLYRKVLLDLRILFVFRRLWPPSIS